MKRMFSSRFLKSLFIVFIAFIVFYSFIYYLSSNGDAFGSFVSWSNNSHALQIRFGEIKSIHLKFLGSYNEKTRGDTGYASFTANVEGSASSGDAIVSMKQIGGVWKVNRVEVDGHSIAAEE